MELFDWNWLSVLAVIIIAYSAVRGLWVGAFGTVRELYGILFAGIATVVTIFLSWQITAFLSPLVQSWLKSLSLQPPAYDANGLEKTFQLIVLSLRDFSLLRFGLILLVVYSALIQPIAWFGAKVVKLFPQTWPTGYVDDDDDEVTDELEHDKHARTSVKTKSDRLKLSSLCNAAVGGMIGFFIGCWRTLIFITVVFVMLVLYPQAPFASYIQQSSLYQLGVSQIIEPFSGDFIKSKVPVWTQQLEAQLQQIIKQKYKIDDANIPQDIAAAAKQISERATTDEEKARALYRWVGTRIQYDYEKVRKYEQENVWLEQTPDDTFRTRKGVCIDYSRLYAVMARSIGLDVKIVTGLGYDGRGGYGPHAWNEVLIEGNQWVPLDSTWHSSGSNWFNPPDFYRTHVRQDVL